MKLWLGTDADDACETATPAGGDWLIRNNEDRNVHVVIRRATTQGDTTREDEMKDTLGPRETREMGCEMSPEGRQTLSIVAAKF